MPRRSGLGKGLEALIPENENHRVENGVAIIPIDQITLNPRQPRKNLNPGELSELAASIREHGIIQPLTVAKDSTTDLYTLIAGERRLRAAKLAGLTSVPVLFRQATEQEHLELALIENIQRTDLTPLETAEAYRQLNEEFGLSHELIAQQVGKSRTSITNTLRLLKLHDFVKSALVEGRISEGHARALLALPTTQSQKAALEVILSKNLNVRQTEELVQELTGKRTSHSETKQTNHTPEFSEVEEQLRNLLGTKVNLHNGKKGGRLVIYFYSEEELNSIINQILKD